jgi:hypothetical protein
VEHYDYKASDGQTYGLDLDDGQSYYDAKHMVEGWIAGQKTQQAQQRVQQHPGAATGMAATGGFLRGMPIVGPTLEAGAQRAAARTRSMITGHPFSEEFHEVPEIAKAAEEAHPIAATVGEIAGGVTGTAAGALAFPEAMGVAGTLPQMMRAGAISGGAIGGLDALARGQNPAVGGGLGVGAGMGGPVAGRAAGALLQPAIRTAGAAFNPAAQAWREATSALRRGAGAYKTLSPQEMAAAQARGQPVTPMEMAGGPGRGLLGSAVRQSQEARDVAEESLDVRAQQKNQRLTDWLMKQYHYPDAMAQAEALENVKNTVNKANYDKAHAQGAGGLWSKELALHWEDPAVQAAAKQSMITIARDARNRGYRLTPNDTPLVATEAGPLQLARTADGKVMVPSLRFWDQVQRNLRAIARAEGAGTHGESGILETRKQLNAALDSRVPAFKAARSGASQAFGAEDALEAGQAAVTRRMENRIMRREHANFSPQEKQLFQDGYIDRLTQIIREGGENRQSLMDHYFGSDAGRERLEIAVGREKAKELEAMLRVENIMNFARKPLGGSPTVQYALEMGLLTGGTAAGADYLSGKKLDDPFGVMVGALMGGAKLGGGAASRLLTDRVAVHVARLMTSQDPAMVDRAIKVIAGNNGLLSAIKNTDAAVGQVLSQGAVPAKLRGYFTPEPREEKPTYGGSIE